MQFLSVFKYFNLSFTHELIGIFDGYFIDVFLSEKTPGILFLVIGVEWDIPTRQCL